MKKIIIVLAIVFLSIQGLFATTYNVVQGTVINSYSGSPMSNQAVYISSDSSYGFPYYAVVYTNLSGFYADTIYSIPSATVFYVSTSDCTGSWITNTVVSSSTPMVSNFTMSCNPMGCLASFSVYPDTSLIGYNYYFDDQSTPSVGSINSWSWTFGDGGISNLQYPQHTYATVGIYDVCLTITTDSGCNNTYCDSIQVDSAHTSGCYTYFNYLVNINTVTFAGITNDSLGATYSWNFGDTTTSTLQDPVHIYAGPGTYYVCLTTTTASGCISSTCQYIYVGSTPACSAQFYMYPDSSTLHHYYAVNLATGTPPITYTWSWGDGTYDYTAYPSHTYAAAGLYTICLTITDTVGCTSTYCDSSYISKTDNVMITINVIPNTATGITENNKNDYLKIYPNPATDNISVLTSEQGKLEILNLEGQLMESLAINGNKTTIDVSGFAKGVYFLKIEGTKINKVEKFIKE